MALNEGPVFKETPDRFFICFILIEWYADFKGMNRMESWNSLILLYSTVSQGATLVWCCSRLDWTGLLCSGCMCVVPRMQAMHKDINQNGVKGNKFSINLLPILCVGVCGPWFFAPTLSVKKKIREQHNPAQTSIIDKQFLSTLGPIFCIFECIQSCLLISPASTLTSISKAQLFIIFYINILAGHTVKYHQPNRET